MPSFQNRNWLVPDQKFFNLLGLTRASRNRPIHVDPPASAKQNLSWKHCREQLGVFLFFFRFILYWHLVSVFLVVSQCSLVTLWKLKPLAFVGNNRWLTVVRYINIVLSSNDNDHWDHFSQRIISIIWKSRAQVGILEEQLFPWRS